MNFMMFLIANVLTLNCFYAAKHENCLMVDIILLNFVFFLTKKVCAFDYEIYSLQ